MCFTTDVLTALFELAACSFITWVFPTLARGRLNNNNKNIPQSSGVTWHEAGVVSSSIRQSETTCVLQFPSVQMRGWIPTAKTTGRFT